jgi:hypothetical protein
MPEVLRRVVWIVALLCFTLPVPGWATDDPIRVAGDPRPAVLDLVDTSTPPQALAVGPDGRNAAASYPDPKKPDRSVVKLYASYRDEPLVVEFSTIVRGLVFSPDGLEVYVASYRPAKRRLGEAHLSSLDVASGKSRSIMPIPPTTSSVDYWPAHDSLLLTTMNEIRTIRVAGMRSGPLYRIPGLNRAVASLAGSTAVLVGQDDDLLLIDLEDPPGEDAMPVRERVAVPAAVASLAALPDGSGALARLSDGRVYRVSFDPLAIEASGSALALAALRKQDQSTTIAMAPLPAPPPDPVPSPETVTATAPEENREAAASPPEAPSVPAPPPTLPVESAVATAPSWTPTDQPQLWGRLTGDAVDEVHEIILLGPNSIVREARRVRPQADGLWRADGLDPGRYQIQLSAGGSKVLVNEPRIAVVEVTESGSIEATSFRVLRAFVP